eukprot:11165107-Lingulodinium_polyedra.AAC.2
MSKTYIRFREVLTEAGRPPVLRDHVKVLHLVAGSSGLDHLAACAQGFLGVVQEELQALAVERLGGGRVAECADHAILVAMAAAVADDVGVAGVDAECVLRVPAGQENAAYQLFVVLLAEAGDADVGVRDGFARRPHGVADAYVGGVLQGSAAQLPD